jgi:hypothetical protein
MIGILDWLDAKLAARQVIPRYLLLDSASSENFDRAEKSPSAPIQNGISKQQVTQSQVLFIDIQSPWIRLNNVQMT